MLGFIGNHNFTYSYLCRSNDFFPFTEILMKCQELLVHTRFFWMPQMSLM